ncbi:MAG: hypothetical protein LUM44_12165 [Pyrinomonadaceae bacterium]|nr:hypothetical protein [Pyrinomonadaceae bacterium]
MAKMKFITQRRQTFFQAEKEFRFCTGAKKTYDENYREDGYGFIEWDAQISGIPVEKVKLLIVEPGKPQIKKAVLPAFVFGLSKLEHIVFDISFLKNKQAEKLPASLRSMMLSRRLAFKDIVQDLVKNKVEWQDGTRLENLEALFIIADEEKEKITTRLSAENLPGLKYLGFKFTNKNELETFSRFSDLTDLELGDLRDFPLFEHIAHLPLYSLDLTGTGNKFDISGLKNLKTLKYLRLNGIRPEIDCNIFTELPELTELVVLNSKKILNVEALLDCRNLKSINFLDCADPFKKGIKDKFNEDNYEILEIKYA